MRGKELIVGIALCLCSNISYFAVPGVFTVFFAFTNMKAGVPCLPREILKTRVQPKRKTREQNAANSLKINAAYTLSFTVQKSRSQRVQTAKQEIFSTVRILVF